MFSINVLLQMMFQFEGFLALRKLTFKWSEWDLEQSSSNVILRVS
jgi:hypothetical protein